MTTTSQIKHLIEKFEIKEKIEKSFLKILEIHTCDDLDIENKNISINIKNIEHFKTELGYNKFQTPLLNNLKNEDEIIYTQALSLCNISSSHLYQESNIKYYEIGWYRG